jgi:hypothetical protein
MRRFQPLLVLWCLLLVGIICIAQSERVSASWQSRDSNYNIAVSGGGGSGSTFDPSHCSTSVINLSNGNLTATTMGGGLGEYYSCRTTVSHTTGKFYRETTLTALSAASDTVHGVMNSSQTIGPGDYVGDSTNSEGWVDGGPIYYNAVLVATIQSCGVGGVVQEADDLTDGKVWWACSGGNWNNSGTANPATNTGGETLSPTGTIYSGVSFYGMDTATVTLNFGGGSCTGFAYSKPAGFSCW